MPNSLQMRFFKPDLSSLGGVFKTPKLGPRHDKMAAHVSESPTTVLLPKGYDDIVNCFFPVVHHSLWGSHILFSRNLQTKKIWVERNVNLFLQKCCFLMLPWTQYILFIAGTVRQSLYSILYCTEKCLYLPVSHQIYPFLFKGFLKKVWFINIMH